MKKYYILRADGSSVFSEGYTQDFIYHCYYKLTECSEESFRVISLSFPSPTSLPTFSYLPKKQRAPSRVSSAISSAQVGAFGGTCRTVF